MAGVMKTKSKQPITVFSGLVWLITRIGLPLLLLYGLLWWRADAAIEKQLDRMRPFVNVQRSGTVLGLNGDVGIRNVRMTPVEGSPLGGLTVRAKRAVIQTPGLWWLVRASVFGAPKEIPSRIGFRLDHASIDGDPDVLNKAIIGGHVVFPFDLAGCDTPLSIEVLRALGSDNGNSSFQATLTHPSARLLRWDISADSPGMVKVVGELEMEIGADGEMARRFAAASFKGFQVAYTDLGFAANRNSYCQKRTGLDAATFATRHVEAASRSFAAHGVKPGAALTEAYSAFSRNGGTLTIAARPRAPVPLVELAGVNLESASFLLHTTVRHDDSATGAMTFLPIEGYVPTTTPSNFSGRDVPVAATRDASVSAPRVAIGAEIPYAELGAYVGDEVEVTTNMNSKRRGTLQGKSLMGVSLKAPAAEGGYSLSIPKYTIVNVVLVGSSVPSIDPGSQNAQKN